MDPGMIPESRSLGSAQKAIISRAARACPQSSTHLFGFVKEKRPEVRDRKRQLIYQGTTQPPSHPPPSFVNGAAAFVSGRSLLSSFFHQDFVFRLLTSSVPPCQKVLSPANIEISTAKRLASFGDLLNTLTETVAGIKRYMPTTVTVAPGRSGANATTDQLLQVDLECIGPTDASSPPDLSAITIPAAVEGETPDDITERIRTSVLLATIGYL